MSEVKRQEKGFFDGIVEKLKSEALKLQVKLESLDVSDNYNVYIATIKSLRETLDLISRYDWQLMYSEYTTDEYETKTDGLNTNTTFIKQVAVWEQNQSGEIRNHKVWNVLNKSTGITTKRVEKEN